MKRLGFFQAGNEYALFIEVVLLSCKISPLGNEHIHYLLILILDKRLILLLSFALTADEKEVNVVYYRHFASKVININIY